MHSCASQSQLTSTLLQGNRTTLSLSMMNHGKVNEENQEKTEDKDMLNITPEFLIKFMRFVGVKASHHQSILDYFNGLKHSSTRMCKKEFICTVSQLLENLGYLKQSEKKYLETSIQIQLKQKSVCILLGGTSGCGKSTLASLLAARLGTHNIISTDNIRHIMRSFLRPEDNPFIFTSSYQSGNLVPDDPNKNFDDKVVEGYQRQSQSIIPHLFRLITYFKDLKESVIIEGVHLMPSTIVELSRMFHHIIPFTIFVRSQTKHKERFAIRAKYMTLDANVNTYIKHFENIRIIQSFLVKSSIENNVGLLENSNMDKSLALLHAVIIHSLSEMNEIPSLNLLSITRELEHAELDLLGSKDAMKLIQRKNGLRKRTMSDTTGMNRSNFGKC